MVGPDHNMRAVLAVLLLAVGCSPLQACDVPVYRYALEHWSPDPYQVVILNHGPLDAASRAVADKLERQSQEEVQGNFAVQVIDVDQPRDDAERELAASTPCGDGPQLVVSFPSASQIHGVAWQGRFNADAAITVADSPCRREIARRLLAGDAVVWVLLRTGRKNVDDAAAACLEQELMRPAGDGQSPLASSLVHVSRSDPEEKLLVETLLSVEPDLRGRGEPMAFPVFGRGRVLYALVGAGINAETVRHALDFLIGGCSCTIKRGNPGLDLLLAADWSVMTPTTPEDAAAASISSGDLVPLTRLAPTHTAAPSPAEPAAAGGPNPWLIVGAIGVVILVLTTGWLALRSGRRRDKMAS
ncbi:MAG TPA: hypothetical protein VMS17_00485 [Gemmataceae bacterium]|nr:hypothetical protein [Gemmataceae bacterium]